MPPGARSPARRVPLRRTHALQMAPDVALQEDRCGKARGMPVQGDVTVGGRIDGLVAEVDVAGQLGPGLKFVLERGFQHLLDRLVVKCDPVTGDLDRDREARHFLAYLVVRRYGRLYPIADHDELETLRLAGQLIRDLRDRIFRIDVSDAVDIGLLYHDRRSRVGATSCGLRVGNAEIVVIIALDVGDRAGGGVSVRTGGNSRYANGCLALRAHHRDGTLGRKFLASLCLRGEALREVLSAEGPTKAKRDYPRGLGGIDL